MQNGRQVTLTLSAHHFVSVIMSATLKLVELSIVYTVDNYSSPIGIL